MAPLAEAPGRYTPPTVEDFGTLADLTADLDLSVPIGLARSAVVMLAISAPIIPPDTPGPTPGGGGGGGTIPPDSGVVPDVDQGGSPPPSPDGDVLGGAPETGGAPDVTGDGVADDRDAGGALGGGTGGGGEGGGDNGVLDAAGRLPFTGYAVAVVAAVGAGLLTASAGLRAGLRRLSPRRPR